MSSPRFSVVRAIGLLGIHLGALASWCGLDLPCQGAEPPRLVVSENRRFLIREGGQPFFYLADTAWELFHRLNREDAEHYFSRRAAQGFTVIQMVALAEFDGLVTPNAYGHLPLVDNDPARPATQDGPRNDYWDHVDEMVAMANTKGLVVGFLPSWGDKWNKAWGKGPEVFTPENARAYGRWLGERYKQADLIWILGGDRAIETDAHRQIITAMAEGLKEGDGGKHLMTFHPPGGHGSSEWWHEAPWLDFNMRQNGHGIEFNRYVNTRKDYDLAPTKPVLDGEPAYEDHPVAFNSKEFGYVIGADTRRFVYWDLFSGACGHTYGDHCVWQMFDAGREPINGPLFSWKVAVESPGAGQMVYAKRLIESRPVLTRIPDDELIAQEGTIPGGPPLGAGTRRMVATRDSAGSYAFVYVPVGRSFGIRTDKLTGQELRAWWYDPRNGESKVLGKFPRTGDLHFIPPALGEFQDWVLVLDDVSKNYPAPGTPLK